MHKSNVLYIYDKHHTNITMKVYVNYKVHMTQKCSVHNSCHVQNHTNDYAIFVYHLLHIPVCITMLHFSPNQIHVNTVSPYTWLIEICLPLLTSYRSTHNLTS